MLLARYAILIDGKRDPRLKIRSEIKIQDQTSRIEVHRDGIVEIYAENKEKLEKLKAIALISSRYASDWMPFRLSCEEVTDLETGRQVSLGGVVMDGTVSVLSIRQDTFQKAADSLLRVEYPSLLFLIRSTEGLQPHNEISILLALVALELKLNEVVPIEAFTVRQKLAVLKWLRGPSHKRNDLKKLFSLRNCLAHGHWKGKKLTNRTIALLGGGPKDWFLRSGYINASATHEILEKVIFSLEQLSSQIGGKTKEKAKQFAF